MQLGFIGFGAMGRPMAEHLLGAGHALSVWSRRPEAVDFLLAQGALWCSSPAEVAQTVVHAGEAGAGQVAKACNQIVMVAAIEAAAEAARLAAACGIDFAGVRAAMLGGSAASRVLDVFGGRMAAHDFMPGVEVRLHHKDYALLKDEAARTGVALPISAAVWQQLNAVMGRGWGTDDSASLLRALGVDCVTGPAR